ncbi:MAG: hypothetical protein H7263_13660 [Candidatus Sericytochromatia bacterium]|nr:hypothetical protein [Candidatus Sericytochromatia bacterium]
MQKKIINKKEFTDFMTFMLDESEVSQKKRMEIYEEYGSLSPESKAKYIIEKIGSYIYKIVSQIEDDDDEVDNSKSLQEMQFCFSGLKKILKADEQLTAFNEAFKTLNFEKKFDDLENVLANHKKDIYKFTNTIFGSIINNLNENNPPNLLDLKELITSEEIYDYVVKKDNNLSQEDYNIGKILISALNKERSSVNAEIIGRVYAYVKSGWAQADLFDGKSINDTVKKLNDIITSIRENSLSLPTSEKESNNQKLAEIFTERLNQIAVTVVYNRSDQDCYAQASDLIDTKLAKAGTADVLIPYYSNPSTLLTIYCTSNESLFFTGDGEKSWSVLSHQKINNNFLIGKSIKNIDKDKDNKLSKNLDKKIYENKIENVEVINISPAILGNKSVLDEFREIFKKPILSTREKSLINSFPIFNIISKYKPDDQSGKNVTVNELLNIKENIILNERYESNSWDAFSQQVNIYKPTKDNLEHFYINRFLIPYVEELWNVIQNKEIKEGFVIANYSTKTLKGKATFFIKEFPDFFSTLIDKLSEDDDRVLFNKNSREIMKKIATELENHTVFNSKESLNTLKDPMKTIKRSLKEIQEQDESKKIKSIIKRK